MNYSVLLFLVSAITLQFDVHAQAADTLYDGMWIGQIACSEGVAGRTLRAGPFNAKISFFVTYNKGYARFDTPKKIEQYNLAIGPNSKVVIDAFGARKDNTNHGWMLKAEGSLAGNAVSATGAMMSADGKVRIRNVCTFTLQNKEVENRLAASKKEQEEAAARKLEQAGATKAAQIQEPVQPKPASQEMQDGKKSRGKNAGAVALKNTEAVTTAAPKPVPATASTPARTAAIANVDVPKGSSDPSLPTKVTTNPIDKIRKTGSNEVWISFNPSITVQERQFCRIIENYRAEYAAAQASNNQIKVNESVKNMAQAINSLLPDGKIQGWVMRGISIAQSSDGSADVLFELPCKVYVGSNTCDSNPKNFYGTVPEGSRVYTELSKMTVNDFALVSGQFVYADEKVFDKNRSVASYGYMKTAAHCKAKAMQNNADFFGVKVDTLSTIK
jgi:hypothetical protein